MGTFYRVFAPEGHAIGDAESIDGIVEIARNAAPGRYRIDCISADPGSAGPNAWPWGAVIKSRHGRITLDTPPWLD